MNRTTSLATFSAGAALLTATSAFAAISPDTFRAEAPLDRPISDVIVKAPGVAFRDTADLPSRAAVAMSTAAMFGADFTPSEDVGSANFSKRPFRFTFSLSTGYDDNINTSSFDKQSSFFTSGSIGANVTFSDGQTSLKAALSAGGSYYWDRQDSFDPDITLNIDLSHAFSPTLRLDISSYLAYQAEPNFQLGFGQTRRSGNYVYGSVNFSLAQSFTRRFSMVYSYTVSGVYYDQSTFGDLSNRIEQTAGLQLRYLIQPSISLAAEYRFGLVSYDASNRDSTSNFVLAGFDFTLNRRLTASLRAGAQFRDSDDAGQETSPFVESTLSYSYGKRASIQFLNRYGIEESDLGFGSTRKTYRTGLSINQGISSRIGATGGVYFTTSQYDGPFAENEETLDFNAGLTFAVNSMFSLNAGYTYTKIFSDAAFREYDRNRVYLGATVTF